MATTAAAERRDPTAPRRPFRAPVDIADIVDQEIWQGDARDLSISGMSVQSAMVPEVGEELACRFRLEGGEQIESRVEVVWAREAGARDGEFGVRFTALDANLKETLRKVLPAPVAPVAATPASAPTGGIHENSKVRIVIPGMEAPLRARVRTRAQGALIVGSDLTFLRLGERVAVDGGSERADGNITAVDIEVDKRSGVPRLILTIDGAGEAPGVVPPAVAPATSEAAPRVEVGEAERDTKVEVKPASEAARAEAAPRPERARAAQETRVLSTHDEHELPDDEAFDTRTWAQRALEAAKVNAARLAAAAGPAARDAGKAVGGAVDALRARVRGGVASVEQPRREPRVTLNRNGLRRQHAEESEGAAAPVRNRRTMVLAGVGGAAALGIVALAVTGGPKPQAPRPQVTIAREGLNPDALNAADEAATTPITLGAAPTAMQPEPQMIQGEAGSLPVDLRAPAAAPSETDPVQVTRRAARAAASPRATPTTRVAAGRMTLGNPAIRAGTLMRIRTDGPITRLDGVGARGADIVISIPGRRSLDLGAPLARLDSRIASSRVMNRSTGAVLTLHFRTAAPPFSARAVGNNLHVVLGATPGVRARARR
ncbi:MAG: PilZ domain-containing protein [Polyangiales bacterium]